jgi:CheY-like chemotaxis protein
MVRDTGPGLDESQRARLFGRFARVEDSAAPGVGGLGLAISRELATLLGGEIRLVSTAGQGSSFTLYLPISYTGPAMDPVERVEAPSRSMVPMLATARAAEAIKDDRNDIQTGDNVLLIVDDDPHYARVLLGLARDKGFKGIVAQKGQVGLALAREFRPTAITLDVFLPDMLGWTVLNNLKLDPATRHIPVQMLSVEEERQHGLSHGAFSYLVKPATTGDLEQAFDRIRTYIAPQVRRLLVVEDNAIERASIVELLQHDDIEIEAVATGSAALEALEDQRFDCCVIDLRLPDMTGFDLLDYLQTDDRLRELPVVVFTGKELTADEHDRLRTLAKSVIVKDVQSPERLLDETALFLHRVVDALPESKRRMLERLHGSNEVLQGRRVLVVDDDARNIFALTTVLENHGMEVLSATNGRDAINIVQATDDLSVVLMDIMMPDMDGYETMRQIRRDARFRLLPILALTAKAMKGDREKCLEAGASDYIAKPVNTEQLMSLLRVWLHR